MKGNFLCIVLVLFASVAFAVKPNPRLTPGALCSPGNPNFTGYRYAAHVAYCKRNVTHAMKLTIAQAYGGIPESEWPKYEFDHLIPLNAGGSSDIDNVWPQPIDEARAKDKVEMQTYLGLNDGSLDQPRAVQMIWDWVDHHFSD